MAKKIKTLLAAMGVLAGMTGMLLSSGSTAAFASGPQPPGTCIYNDSLIGPNGSYIAVESLYPAPNNYELRSVLASRTSATYMNICEVTSVFPEVDILMPYSNGYVQAHMSYPSPNTGLLSAKEPSVSGTDDVFDVQCGAAGKYRLEDVTNAQTWTMSAHSSGYDLYAMFDSASPSSNSNLTDADGQLAWLTGLSC